MLSGGVVISARFTGCSYIFPVDSSRLLPVSYISGHSAPAVAITELQSATAIMSAGRSLLYSILVGSVVFLTASAQGAAFAGAGRHTASCSPQARSSPIRRDTWIRTRPVFVWTSVPGAVSYVLQVTQDSVVRSLCHDRHAGYGYHGGLSATPHARGSRYCWRVGVIDAAGQTAFSDSVWCVTGPAPAARTGPTP